MNPCRCGHLGNGVRPCSCSPAEITRHRARLSGPLLDRIDLFIEVGPWEGAFLTREDAQAPGSGRGSWRTAPRYDDLVRARSLLRIWRRRARHEILAAAAAGFLDQARQPLGLSLRGVMRCIAVATTVAALDDASVVSEDHIREALEFRREVLAG
jgi:magnesium chelatase family protein